MPNFENFEDRFQHAKSPWIISQKLGGKPVNLFRLHALDAGQDISTLYKISIEDLSPSTNVNSKYGTFTLSVRAWNDRDSTTRLIASGERFLCDLNPSSNRYIGKVIGDLHVYYDFDRNIEEQKLVVEGNYANNSNYIRVEIAPDVENGFVDSSALPMGFRGVAHLVTSGSAVFAQLPAVVDATPSLSGGSLDANILRKAKTPPVPFRKKVTDGIVNSDSETENSVFYWGTQFEHTQIITKPNFSTSRNDSIRAFAKYFPDFSTTIQATIVGDNTDVANTAAHGVIDADKFCNNLFSLENIQVVTGSSGNEDPDTWIKAVYVRS